MSRPAQVLCAYEGARGDSHFGDDDIILNTQLDFLKRSLDLRDWLSNEYYIHPVHWCE